MDWTTLQKTCFKIFFPQASFNNLDWASKKHGLVFFQNLDWLSKKNGLTFLSSISQNLSIDLSSITLNGVVAHQMQSLHQSFFSSVAKLEPHFTCSKFSFLRADSSSSRMLGLPPPSSRMAWLHVFFSKVRIRLFISKVHCTSVSLRCAAPFLL